MKSASVIASFILFTSIILAAGSRDAVAQSPSQPRDIPQSLRVEHEDTLEQLTTLSKRRTAVGAEARKALAVFKKHIQREEEYILPPLTLLPYLADGKVAPDMKWAIAMADRVKAEREQIFQEHTQITDAMNALATAARQAHDIDALHFAQAAAADSLNDIELLEPMTMVIGDYLRAKLPQ